MSGAFPSAGETAHIDAEKFEGLVQRLDGVA